ncbi:BTB/POZ and MATH domain-containing protein 2-like [Aegilops tauschii subsp. strangulata]|uniref:Speckle-type POZ protein-like protein n=1 Tax=Aegilops tauschii TaxID=37682 RepID=M8BT38_AEGTA
MAYLWFLSPAGLVDTKYTLSVLGNEGEESAASFGVLEGVFSAVEPNNCWGTELKPLSELGDGGFTLQYVLTVINVESRPMELPGHLERMLANGRRADVRFRVRGRNFRAHSSILAERSPVFEAQLFGPMAEKDMRRIKVVGMRPAIFKMMLRYIYTDILPSYMQRPRRPQRCGDAAFACRGGQVRARQAEAHVRGRAVPEDRRRDHHVHARARKSAPLSSAQARVPSVSYAVAGSPGHRP